jgi:hypothetical protein
MCSSSTAVSDRRPVRRFAFRDDPAGAKASAPAHALAVCPTHWQSMPGCSPRSYNNITQAVVVFMDCVSVSSDYVMKESPAVSCNSSAYKQLYPLFSVLLYGVVVGGPIILLGLLWFYHGRRLQLDRTGNTMFAQSQMFRSGALSLLSASRQSMLAVLYETFKPRYWCVQCAVLRLAPVEFLHEAFLSLTTSHGPTRASLHCEQVLRAVPYGQAHANHRVGQVLAAQRCIPDGDLAQCGLRHAAPPLRGETARALHSSRHC